MHLADSYKIGPVALCPTVRTRVGDILVHHQLGIDENPTADWFLLLDHRIRELRPQHDVRAGLLLTQLFPTAPDVVYPRTKVWLYMIEDGIGYAQIHLHETLQHMEKEMADYRRLVQKTEEAWENTFGQRRLRSDK